MPPLTASTLLALWEHTLSEPPARRCIALLAAAYSDWSLDELHQLSVGRRDALLLQLRDASFGPSVEGVATCPDCGQRTEISFDTSNVRLPEATDAFAGSGLTLTVGAYFLRYRLPNSLDLVEAAGCSDVHGARTTLIARCVSEASRDGVPVDPAALPDDVITPLGAAMTDADPIADVQLAVACAQCGRAWSPSFDIASYIWAEIDIWARRTLRQVQALASAFGWSEREILDLSPWRRQAYIDLAYA